jgi:hypothetical protein
VNRLQALVLGFFLLAWVGLAAILALAPDVYDQSLRLRFPRTRLLLHPLNHRGVLVSEPSLMVESHATPV